jgi:AcrR family transcriptional regulator
MSVKTERPTRAAALPPEERRAAIVAAALPLLREHGLNVTTRQVADAAGIAEGTIFRVFADKDALISAVLDAAADTTLVDAAIAAIEPGLALEAELEAIIVILQERTQQVWRLFSAVADSDAARGRPKRPMTELPSLVARLRAHDGELAQDPARAARMVRGLTLALTHPMLEAEPPPPAEIVTFLLDGLRRRPSPADVADIAGAADPAAPALPVS